MSAFARTARLLSTAVIVGAVVGTACATGPELWRGPSDVDVVRWVRKTVAERQPTAEERRFDDIGWVTEIRTAVVLGKAHQRPIFLTTGDGRISTGRC